MKIDIKSLVVLTIAVSLLLGFVVGQSWRPVEASGLQAAARPWLREQTIPGCQLIVPAVPDTRGIKHVEMKPRAYLVSMSGRVVNQWSLDLPGSSAKLMPDGSLWILTGITWFGPPRPRITHLSWDGKKIVEYENQDIHHEFSVIANDRLLITSGRPLTEQEFKKFSLPKKRETEAPWRSDVLEIVNPFTKEVFWRWDAMEHFKPDFIPDGYRDTKRIFHIDSVQYIEKDPFSQENAVLFSSFNKALVLLVRIRDKKLLWDSSQLDMRITPHDAHMLKNGQIMIFDNGPSIGYSRILQVDMLQNKVTWKFSSIERQMMSAYIFGSSQRLENGNTLISHGNWGHIFEINPVGEVVWEYFNPFDSLPSVHAWPLSPLFKVHRYLPNDIEPLRLMGDTCD